MNTIYEQSLQNIRLSVEKNRRNAIYEVMQQITLEVYIVEVFLIAAF